MNIFHLFTVLLLCFTGAILALYIIPKPLESITKTAFVIAFNITAMQYILHLLSNKICKLKKEKGKEHNKPKSQ